MARRRESGVVRFSRLPKGVQHAGAIRVEQQQERSSVTDLLFISNATWQRAQWHVRGLRELDKAPGPLKLRLERTAKMFGVTPRTVRRWLHVYRQNPDVVTLIPRKGGPKLGHRRLSVPREQIAGAVIDVWVQRMERLPVSWIVEECARRCRRARLQPINYGSITARLRDRGLLALKQGKGSGSAPPKGSRPPRSMQPLAIVQMDHTLVDIMVVDEIHRQSIGRPWVTIAFDIATRVVLGFVLSLNPPSAVSVGLALAMAGLPKDRWLAERELDIDWPMFGLPRILHLDNGQEFHSLALSRGCERYGISLEYRPPGRPHHGGHIERYLGTLMRRIHGLPGTTMSNPADRGKYPSEAKASMTLAELERWMALEIAGRYHLNVHQGLHAIPARVWANAIRRQSREGIADPARFVVDFLPASTRRVGRSGFQLNLIRYWDPLLTRLFPIGTRVLVRFDPRDLSRVYIPSPEGPEYLSVPYADLRRPPITLSELERARTILTAKGDRQPTEDQIFETTEAQRRIEERSAHRTRTSRRSMARRPKAPTKATRSSSAAPVDYSRPAVPYGGEEW